MSRRAIVLSISLAIVLVMVLLNYKAGNLFNGEGIIKLKSLVTVSEPVRVYGPMKGCKAHFVQDHTHRVKQLLSVKTTPEAEELLHRLGFPKRLTPSGQVYIPDFPDPQIDVPEVPVILAGASSNHFLEMQAMMKNVDTLIRPVYPNIKVILYDIGFTEKERKQILKYGKVELRKFPFEDYPEYVRNLQFYAWKPILIAKALLEFRFVLYMDSSIRFTTGNLSAVIQEAKVKGHALLVFPKSGQFVPNNTLAGTFDYFNTSPCLYLGFREIGGGLLLIHENHLNSYALMRAWLTCMFQKKCIVPAGAEKMMSCVKQTFHRCHRYDQSVLGIASGLLYHTVTDTPAFPLKYFEVKRGHTEKYFPEKVL